MCLKEYLSHLCFDVKISGADKYVLKGLTYILCGLSVVGLMATLAVFFALRLVF